MHGRILQISSISSAHPFGLIYDIEDRLFEIQVDEEFMRAFIFYACTTILALISRVDGCRNL